MRDVYHNDTPFEADRGAPLRGEAFAGEYEPVTLSLVAAARPGQGGRRGLRPDGPGRDDPLAGDRRGVRLEPDQSGDDGRDRLHDQPAADHALRGRRRARGPDAPILADGPHAGRCPARHLQGRGHGPAGEGEPAQVPLEFRVRAGTLDPVDVPAGPFGHAIGVPWYDDDPGAAAFNAELTAKSLRKMREYGFTAFSGMPTIPYRGFRGGKPVLDFAAADAEMKQVKDMGFRAVVTYGGGVSGIEAYFTRHRPDGRGRVPGLFRVPQGRLFGGPGSRPSVMGGFPSITTSATSRSAMT